MRSAFYLTMRRSKGIKFTRVFLMTMVWPNTDDCVVQGAPKNRTQYRTFCCDLDFLCHPDHSWTLVNSTFQVEGGYRQPTEGAIYKPLDKGDDIKLEVGYSARACAIRFAMSRALVGLVDEEMRKRLRAGELYCHCPRLTLWMQNWKKMLARVDLAWLVFTW